MEYPQQVSCNCRASSAAMDIGQQLILSKLLPRVVAVEDWMTGQTRVRRIWCAFHLRQPSTRKRMKMIRGWACYDNDHDHGRWSGRFWNRGKCCTTQNKLGSGCCWLNDWLTTVTQRILEFYFRTLIAHTVPSPTPHWFLFRCERMSVSELIFCSSTEYAIGPCYYLSSRPPLIQCGWTFILYYASLS